MRFYLYAFVANALLVGACWLTFRDSATGIQNGVIWSLVLVAGVLDLTAYNLHRERSR